MLRDLKKVNPKAWALAKDTHPFSAGLCPRRAGKSYTGALIALIMGLAKPGSISMIISLNLKQLKRLYWESGPSGLWAIARRYGIELQVNHTALKWTLQNGSVGYLMGAENEEQLENMRGLEADLYLVDECKSFIPERLRTMLDVIIEPQRKTRKGRVVLIGTPGYLKGPFWEATCLTAQDAKGRPLSVAAGQADPLGRDPRYYWSRHHWTLQDNSAMPHQWDEALVEKDKNGWSDDHPIWQMEYLGNWVQSGSGLVYKYLEARPTGRVTWVPQVTPENPTGLPIEGAPWRLIGGLDIGFNDKTALVIAGYSRKLGELRHVWDHSAPHMIVDDVADMIASAYAQFAPHQIEMIYADTGGLGKMVVESLLRRGFPIEAAEKREKYDHIELLNSAFLRGEVKIVGSTTLEHQLSTNAWDLRRGDFEQLARNGRLREDDSVENDCADAFLYAFRGSLHGWGSSKKATPGPEPMSPEWVKNLEREELRKARASFKQCDGLGASPIAAATGPISRALNCRPLIERGLQRSQWMNTFGASRR